MCLADGFNAGFLGMLDNLPTGTFSTSGVKRVNRHECMPKVENVPFPSLS